VLLSKCEMSVAMVRSKSRRDRRQQFHETTLMDVGVSVSVVSVDGVW
jgi:hypothetical protein